MAAQFLLVLDSSVVNVALPSIQRDLAFSPETLSWVVNGYSLTFGGLLLLGGRLADRRGRKLVFGAGVVLFGVASLAGGLAPTSEWLVAARAAQGVGGALVSPAALSLLTTTFAPGPDRNRALGIWGAAVGAAGAVGVLLGGVLTAGLGWRWVLLINVPVCVVLLVLARRVVPSSRPGAGDSDFDVPGAVSVTAGLGLLVLGLVGVPQHGWGSPVVLAELAGAVVLLAAFVVIEARARSPLFPLAVFRRPAVRGANIVCLFCFMALLGMFYFLSLYLQESLGFDALLAGLSYLPLALSILVAANLAGRAVSRFGVPTTLCASLVVFSAGLFWFSFLPVTGGTFAGAVLGPSILAGFGFGGAVVSITVAAVDDAGPDEVGLLSGLINTTQQVGVTLGLGILASVAAASTAASTAGQPIAVVEGYRTAYLVASGFVLAGALATPLVFRGAEKTIRSRT
ncbi:MFS transporter [Amycolatopsis umgeniensis]|uniref:EmrB/QacA subfamily drug resistance transporter n=1 Tax=Amycolatopsis umgeniensis TaxID=336628 RepID=A0A841BFK8_9PSEU|nr:EmrB/QacA subfamily drug resistance transporter [Amycolatopsis umgeniensis]